MKALLTVKGGLTDRKEYALEEGKTYLLGRSREADVIVKDRMASRNHCKVVAAPGEDWTVADLGSSNGTYVNRERVTTHVLRDGDVLQVGKATFEFRLTSAAPAAASAPAQVPQGPPPESEDTDTGPRAAPEARPEPPPEPAQAPASHASTARDEKVDDDLRGLFEFLDRIDGGGQSAPKEEAPPKKPSAPAPPPQAPQGQQRRDTDPLSLLDDAVSGRPGQEKPHPPPQPKTEEEGGLLAFLRKKKKP